MEWEEIGPDGGYSRIVGMDPNADWVLGPGLADFARGSRDVLIPFIIAPLDETCATILAAYARAWSDEKETARILVPEFYEEIRPGRYIAAFAPPAFFDLIATSDDDQVARFRQAAKHVRLGLPLPDAAFSGRGPIEHFKALPSPPVWEPEGGWPEETVVVGVIDDGIAFAHERFRDVDGGTRMQYFWRQDGRFELVEPSTVPFGREIWKSDLSPRPGIDSLLAANAAAGLVDEERLYRQAGLVDFTEPGHKAAAWRPAHGTHVLDVAAGFDPSAAPVDRPIVAVQLPVAATADTSGASLEFYVKIAVDYILDRARRLGAGRDTPLPVVINFSYGMLAGPHDGTSALERALDLAIADRNAPLRFVLPAGNGHLSRCHAEIEFQDYATVTLPWRVQPDDRTPSQLEIWLPHEGSAPPAQSRVSIRIETPFGELLSPSLGEQHGAAIQLKRNGQVLAEARYTFQSPPTSRGLFLVTLQPTERLRPVSPVLADRIAPSGLWKVHITRNPLVSAPKLNAWIQRDDVIFGYPRRARQSYFDATCYTRFDALTRPLEDDHEDDSGIQRCHVKRRGLISAIATGCETIVVGGTYRKELVAADYSAGGPTSTVCGCKQAIPREGPDVLAVSDDSRAHVGVLAAGSRSGSTVAMTGTSVAAPMVTRIVAGMLAQPVKTGTRDAVKQLAEGEEMAPSSSGRPPKPRDIRAGAGRLLRPPARLLRIDPDF
jgi:hypothetical protein